MSIRRDHRLVTILKHHGIRYPRTTLRLSRRVNKEVGHMPLSLAAALLEQETAGGHNVYGHDPVGAGQQWGGKVTLRSYRRYKRLRKQGYGMQGVGPLQLTYYTIQDEADRAGGCWRYNVNIYIGLRLLARQIDANAYVKGIERYNGSGAAARAYSKEVRRKAGVWHRRLA